MNSSEAESKAIHTNLSNAGLTVFTRQAKDPIFARGFAQDCEAYTLQTGTQDPLLKPSLRVELAWKSPLKVASRSGWPERNQR
jgi:hypothetical protein